MLNRHTIYKFIVRNNKVIQMKYKPISCSLYDRIESLAVLKKSAKIIFINNDQTEEIIDGQIKNIGSGIMAHYIKIKFCLCKIVPVQVGI